MPCVQERPQVSQCSDRELLHGGFTGLHAKVLLRYTSIYWGIQAFTFLCQPPSVENICRVNSVQCFTGICKFSVYTYPHTMKGWAFECVGMHAATVMDYVILES